MPHRGRNFYDFRNHFFSAAQETDFESFDWNVAGHRSNGSGRIKPLQINDTLHGGPAIGLDWFLLDLFLMALIYVPLERLWPQYPKQGTFRNEWTLDMVYFMSTHLPLQILSFLVLLPATQATKYLGVPALQGLIAQVHLVIPILPGGGGCGRC